MTEPAVTVFVDHLFRHQAGQMIATLTRIFGIARLDQIEDAVQDALVLALRRWPYEPIPENPRAWLIQVAKNRLLDRIRREQRIATEEEIPESSILAAETLNAAGAAFDREVTDDQLRLIFTCCHPLLNKDSRVALTLKTISGFSIGEISRAFLSTETAVTKMLVRARQKLREQRVQLEMPSPNDLTERLQSVLEVVYLMFNEGYSATQGEELVRTDLCYEALRLSELLAAQPMTGNPETHALAALLSFQGARLKARANERGELTTLEEQDRSLWDPVLLRRGLHHMRLSASGSELSDYHLESEIASCHALSRDFESTDWERVVVCYEELYRRNRSPIVALNRVVALSHVRGVDEALSEMALLRGHRALQSYHPFFVAYAELLMKAGRIEEALVLFRRAMELTSSEPVLGYIEKRIRQADLPSHRR